MSAADRPEIRELIGRALLSSHLEEPAEGRLGAVHRIGAMAAAPRLGSAAWRLKFAHDAKCYHQALDMVEHRVRMKLRLPLTRPTHWHPGRWDKHRRGVRQACEQSLREWLAPGCEGCGGSGRRAPTGYVIAKRMGRGTRPTLEVCSQCLGSGDRAWTDVERAQALKVGLEGFRNGLLPKVIDKAGRVLRGADRNAGAAVSRQLGMRPPEE